jgi:hypothetical protein
MQRTLHFTLLLAAVLVAGCAPSPPFAPRPSVITTSGGAGRWLDHDLIVEGVAYNMNCSYRFDNDKLHHFIVLVFPDEQHYFPAFGEAAFEPIETKLRIYAQPDWADAGYKVCENYLFKGFGKAGQKSFNEDGQYVEIADDVDSGYVYLIDDGKIVLRKSIAELGIDVSDASIPFPDGSAFLPAANESYLHPILEKLIREHVQTQEPKTEEQEQ